MLSWSGSASSRPERAVAAVTRWRTYGNLRLALSGPRLLVDDAQRFFGARGWSSSPPPPGTLRAHLSSDDGQPTTVECGAPALGEPWRGPPHEVWAGLEATCVTAALQRTRAVGLHAATVARRTGHLLVAGPHEAGKSTLGLALALGGHAQALLGDDVCLIAPKGRARAFPRLLRVRPPTVGLLGIDAVVARRGFFDEGDRVHRVTPPLPAARRVRAERRVRDIVVLDDGPPGLQRLSSERALPILLEQRFASGAGMGEAARCVVELLATARVFRHGGRTAPLAMAEAIARALDA